MISAVSQDRAADHMGQRARRPGRKPRFDCAAYRRRAAIERTVGALTEAQAVATRYERLKTHYLALVTLGVIRLLARRLDAPLPHRA